jgi:hypothetical protein
VARRPLHWRNCASRASAIKSIATTTGGITSNRSKSQTILGRFFDAEDLWVYFFLLLDRLDKGGMTRIGHPVRRRPPPPLSTATPVFNFCQMSNFLTFWSFVDTEDLWVHVFLLLDRLDESECGGMRRIGQTVRRRPPPPLSANASRSWTFDRRRQRRSARLNNFLSST